MPTTTRPRSGPRRPAQPTARTQPITPPAPAPAPTQAPSAPAKAQERRSRMGPTPRPDDQLKKTNFIMRCRVEYREWINTFAEDERMTPSILVDHALIALARERGFDPPPRR